MRRRPQRSASALSVCTGWHQKAVPLPAGAWRVSMGSSGEQWLWLPEKSGSRQHLTPRPDRAEDPAKEGTARALFPYWEGDGRCMTWGGLGGALHVGPVLLGPPPQLLSRIKQGVAKLWPLSPIYVSIIYLLSINHLSSIIFLLSVYLSVCLSSIPGGRNFKCIIGKMLCSLGKQTHKMTMNANTENWFTTL